MELKIKCTFGDLVRGDQFIGNPHGGWIFVKTDLGKSVRIADGGTVVWSNSDEVYKVRGAC